MPLREVGVEFVVKLTFTDSSSSTKGVCPRFWGSNDPPGRTQPNSGAGRLPNVGDSLFPEFQLGLMKCFVLALPGEPLRIEHGHEFLRFLVGHGPHTHQHRSGSRFLHRSPQAEDPFAVLYAPQSGLAGAQYH